MTVVTIVLVSFVLGMVTLIIMGLMNDTKEKAKCENCGGFYDDDTCFLTEEKTRTINDLDTCQ